MACISKISSGFTYDCDSGITGFVSALLINKEDIASITYDSASGSLVNALTLKTGAKAYKIDTVKRTLITTEALKINEGAPNAFTHSATITVTATMVSALLNSVINPVTNGSFVILARTLREASSPYPGDSVRPYGLYYGMSATAIDRHSHENGGWFTLTMATPEQVMGEDALTFLTSQYDTLYADAVG